jgi:hypothetical protein
MKLDKEQKRRLVGLRNDLFERMESIIEHRRRIISHLEVSELSATVWLLWVAMTYTAYHSSKRAVYSGWLDASFNAVAASVALICSTCHASVGAEELFHSAGINADP